MSYKYYIVYYLKNGLRSVNFYLDKERAEKALYFYTHNSNYTSAVLYKVGNK